MPTGTVGAAHEIFDGRIRPAPAARVDVPASTPTAFGAAIETQPPQQRPEAGCGRFADAKGSTRGMVDQQHAIDPRPLQGQGKRRAGRAGAQDQDVEVTWKVRRGWPVVHFGLAGARGSLRDTSTNLGSPGLPTSRTNPS